MATPSGPCTGPCGHIISYGYPSHYRANERSEWRITVDIEKYISLQFVEFDVYEDALSKCERDYVTVYDVNLVGERTESTK